VGVRLTLITRQVDTPYSGMLPGLVAGQYSYDDIHIDTGPLTRAADARLYNSEVTGLDPIQKLVLCDNRPPVPYDIVSINIGAAPSAHDVPGVLQHTVPVKPIDSFLEHFEIARNAILASQERSHILVIGAGAGGVELMLALQRRLRRDAKFAGSDPDRLMFTLIGGSQEILPSFPPRMRKRFFEILHKRKIVFRGGSKVVRVEPTCVVMDDGSTLPTDHVFWATGSEPANWLAESGLDLDDQGFVAVSNTLQSISHDDVFAAGDIASIRGYNLPKSGVYAVRSGLPLANNLRRVIGGKPLKTFKPQRDAMYLISLGDTYVTGTRNGLVFEGVWAWKWKDWIDRTFMKKFNELPEMTPEAPPKSTVADKRATNEISTSIMRCGGCGGKVGATILSRALAQIEPKPRESVLVGLEMPDDAAIVDTGAPRLTIQTIDHFRSFVDDPYIFGKIAANHALGDIYAMAGIPETALAVASVPYGLESKVETDLATMLLGANSILREADCTLVGGHTSEGSELALGFSVNGAVDRGKALAKGGMGSGDALILTKPVGTGHLLAANMRGKARARWVIAAIDQMMLSNRRAAQIMKDFNATAATDVTGFGLLGHLLEIANASKVKVDLALCHVPLMEGVEITIERKIFSSIQPQNERFSKYIENFSDANAHTLFPVLFDPQTAGGLLFSIPEDRAVRCVSTLQEEGYLHARIIGRAIDSFEGNNRIRVVCE
ncbi:MAG: selenide, water dikinase SelD, partial [Pseudomonadales bacterium]